MALSKRTKEVMIVALADKKAGQELIDRVNTGFNATPASHVASLGSTTNIPASNASLSTSNTYTDAAVKAAIDGAVNAAISATEARLDAIEAKVDAILAALQAAGLMS